MSFDEILDLTADVFFCDTYVCELRVYTLSEGARPTQGLTRPRANYRERPGHVSAVH